MNKYEVLWSSFNSGMKSSESEFNLNYSKIIDVSVQTTIGKKNKELWL